MRWYNKIKWPIIVVCVVGIVFVLSILFSFASGKSFEPLSSLFFRSQVKLPINKTTSSSSVPVRLQIPDINVDALIIPVGITASGAVDVPKNSSDVAWFDLGPRPGDIGSAVVSGHYGWRNGTVAVFDNLSKLKKGDKVYVSDDKDNIVAFVVRELQIYDKNQDVSSVFASNDEKAHLILITCEGIWDSTQKTYSNRLVVFTDKE